MKRPNTNIIKFLVSGMTAATIEYIIFALLTAALSVFLVFANTVSFLMGAFVSFALNKKWVFASTGNANRQFGAYMVLAIINVALSNVAILLLTSGANIQPLIAKAITMVAIASMNYLIFSKIIFK